MENTKLNLYQKLAKIRDMSDAVVKNKKGFNYKYTDITEILAKVTAGMKKYGVTLIPSIVGGTSEVSQVTIVDTKIDKSGKPYDKTTTEMLVKSDLQFTWVNDENPNERITVPWFMTGSMSDPAQALGAANTYSQRQFLMSYFQIAQQDSDVDAYRTKQKEAEMSEDKAIAEAIIAEFDITLKTYLADNQDKADDIKNFVSKYVKKSNYLAIKEPTIAAKLLDDFKSNFLNKKENNNGI